MGEIKMYVFPKESIDRSNEACYVWGEERSKGNYKSINICGEIYEVGHCIQCNLQFKESFIWKIIRLFQAGDRKVCRIRRLLSELDLPQDVQGLEPPAASKELFMASEGCDMQEDIPLKEITRRYIIYCTFQDDDGLNPIPSNEQIKNADYFFYRGYDSNNKEVVSLNTVVDELGAQFVYNKVWWLGEIFPRCSSSQISALRIHSQSPTSGSSAHQSAVKCIYSSVHEVLHACDLEVLPTSSKDTIKPTSSKNTIKPTPSKDTIKQKIKKRKNDVLASEQYKGKLPTPKKSKVEKNTIERPDHVVFAIPALATNNSIEKHDISPKNAKSPISMSTLIQNEEKGHFLRTSSSPRAVDDLKQAETKRNVNTNRKRKGEKVSSERIVKRVVKPKEKSNASSRKKDFLKPQEKPKVPSVNEDFVKPEEISKDSPIQEDSLKPEEKIDILSNMDDSLKSKDKPNVMSRKEESSKPKRNSNVSSKRKDLLKSNQKSNIPSTYQDFLKREKISNASSIKEDFSKLEEKLDAPFIRENSSNTKEISTTPSINDDVLKPEEFSNASCIKEDFSKPEEKLNALSISEDSLKSQEMSNTPFGNEDSLKLKKKPNASSRRKDSSKLEEKLDVSFKKEDSLKPKEKSNALSKKEDPSKLEKKTNAPSRRENSTKLQSHANETDCITTSLDLKQIVTKDKEKNVEGQRKTREKLTKEVATKNLKSKRKSRENSRENSNEELEKKDLKSKERTSASSKKAPKLQKKANEDNVITTSCATTKNLDASISLSKNVDNLTVEIPTNNQSTMKIDKNICSMNPQTSKEVKNDVSRKLMNKGKGVVQTPSTSQQQSSFPPLDMSTKKDTVIKDQNYLKLNPQGSPNVPLNKSPIDKDFDIINDSRLSPTLNPQQKTHGQVFKPKVEDWDATIAQAIQHNRVLLLKNVDPKLNSDDIAEALTQYMRTKCEVRIAPPISFTYGTTSMLLKLPSSKKAQEFLNEAESNFLLVANRLVIATSFTYDEFKGPPILKYLGHLELSQARDYHTSEEKNILATSHFAQGNTIEFAYGIPWRVLDEQYELQWQMLQEVHSTMEEREEKGKKLEKGGVKRRLARD